MHERAPGSATLRRAAVVLAPGLRHDFEPRHLQAVLPKSFIHHAEPGGAVDRFFAGWQAAWRAARRQAGDARAAFCAAGRALRAQGYPVDPRPTLLCRGFLALGAEWPGTLPDPAPTAEPPRFPLPTGERAG